MLHPIGSKRPTMDQIKDHAWWKEQVATNEEVIADMQKNRQHLVDEVLNKEEMDKEVEKKAGKEQKVGFETQFG